MSGFIRQLTDHERGSLRQVHQAIRNNVQSGRLAEIRNDIIFNSDKQFGFVEAFDDILKVNKVYKIGSDSKAWTRLKRIAERYEAEQAVIDGQDTKTWKEWKTRVRHTLFISMQWPFEILTRYGWDTEKFSRDGLRYVYNCAKMCPSFEDDFIPQVNLVHWLKHCSALSALDAAKEHDFAPKLEKVAVKDLHSLSDLSYGRPVPIYGREVTLETAGQLRDEIRTWTENQDGVVFVGGKWLDLKKHRGTLWNIYLLKFDDNGLLVRREESDEVPTPRRDGILSPPPSMRQTESLKPVSTNAAASDMRSSVSGSVAGRAVVNSDDDNTAGSAAEIAAASATCSAKPPAQYNLDLHDIHDTPKTRHSDAESTSSHGTGSSDVKGTPIASVETKPSRPDSACEASCVRRSARSCRMQVAQVFLEDEDDVCDEDNSNDQGPSDKPLDDESPQDQDSDFEGSSNGKSDDLSRANDPVERTTTSTDGMRKERLDVEQESSQEPTQERAVLSHKTPVENEAIADHRGEAEASINVLPGQADELYVREGGNVTADLSGVESWLVGQEDNSLFVGDSPTNESHRKSEAPEASPSASRVSQEDVEAWKDGVLPINGVWIPAKNRNKDASADSDTVTFLPPATRESPKTSRVRTVSPQPVETQVVKTKSSMTVEGNSSGTTDSSSTSDSSSELASWRHTGNSNVARTVQGLTPTSSGRSSSRDDSSPSEASLSNSDAVEAWTGCDARDLTSPLNFAKMGRRTREKLFNASDALAAMRPEKAAEYMYQMPPSIFAPFLPHMSVEEESRGEVWDGGYRMPYGGPRWHSDEDLGSSRRSCGTSQDPPDLPCRHFGPRPESCACDTCDDILPLLERVRAEASSDNASQSCRVRDRWFGNAKWALAVGASDLGEPGSRSEHEVVYHDSASFRDMADEHLLLEKPIVVRELQHDRGLYNLDVVREALRDSHRNRTVTLADAPTDAPTLVAMEEFLMRFATNEWSVSSSTLCDSFGAQRPALLSHNRFRLLHKAVARAACHSAEWSGGGAGCGDIAHSFYVSGGLSFNRIESSGACSGPSLDPLGGTWIRSLEGRRLCAFVPHEQLTTSLLDGSVRDGLEWWPHDKQRLVLLEPDDVLILPPNVFCAQLAVDAGVSFQGSFWDQQEWGRYLAAAQWAVMNPTHVTPQIPRCAARLALHGLKSIAMDNPRRLASDTIAQPFLETDRSGAFETVMAERCAAREHAVNGSSVHRSEAPETPSHRRKSSSQAGVEQARKRMCIREALSDGN